MTHAHDDLRQARNFNSNRKADLHQVKDDDAMMWIGNKTMSSMRRLESNFCLY